MCQKVNIAPDALLGKNEDHISSLYRMYVNSLYNYGKGLGFSHDACLDAIHDVFYKLFSRNGGFDAKSVKPYLFRCFKNQLIDHQKSKKKEVSHFDVNDLPFQVEVTVDDHVVEEEECILLKKKVERLLALLTKRQREAIYLRYMEEMGYDEIGELLHMNVDSVRKLVFRGIEKIRQHSVS